MQALFDQLLLTLIRIFAAQMLIRIFDVDDTAPHFVNQDWDFEVDEHDSSQSGDFIATNLTQKIIVDDYDVDLPKLFFFDLE